ncbi:hypothetical protein HS088_TW12G00893 [Tripterygium wilfordii]|uniref:Uncharacterized protein n=1 Tax=Tripterygium wilfordii TaxID=458696 RepID=A0A7J7D025_TRIWF|nr:hypothetical protein HS088_TW12G00893 [Tripterygium wilfordii]
MAHLGTYRQDMRFMAVEPLCKDQLLFGIVTVPSVAGKGTAQFDLLTSYSDFRGIVDRWPTSLRKYATLLLVPVVKVYGGRGVSEQGYSWAARGRPDKSLARARFFKG